MLPDLYLLPGWLTSCEENCRIVKSVTHKISENSVVSSSGVKQNIADAELYLSEAANPDYQLC